MSPVSRWRYILGAAGTAAGLIVMALIAGHPEFRALFSDRNATAPIQANPSMPAQMNTHASHGSSGSDGASPAGYAEVTIDPTRLTALQLSTVELEESDFTRIVRTVGVVTLDETRSAHVHSKVRGWIDGIHVDYVGRKVSAGEILCSIYSQDVYSAEIEFLSILNRTKGHPGPDPLLDAARQRLALWDVPPSEIKRLETTRVPRRTFPLLAPRAGTVLSKAAIQGMYVDPSLELYTLSDLSRVWVLVDIYEADVSDVHEGDIARLTIEGSATPIDGRVSFLAQTIDEATRTRKVRFEIQNLDGKVLPGAFVTVEMKVPMGTGLAIPESAVIRTGTRSIVFVAHNQNGEHLQPREVTLGPLLGNRYRVESGLSAGERVATGALFLLDSESRLRATSGPDAAHAH